MTIKLLPENLINQIAAGEVVEKPSSVVKELVENAIDANASKISLEIRHAGKSFIAVRDNGDGMDKENLELAILRHATSKLPDTTLTQINHYGFRGEALPSIASVSRMSITSKTAKQERGHKITIEGGKITESKPAYCPQGTSIEVRDIFYATPARLKFLRSDQYEALHIFNSYASLILANPQIAFDYHDGTKQRFALPAIEQALFSEGFTANFFKRHKALFHKELNDNYIHLSQQSDEIDLQGYIGLPTYTAGRNDRQFFFVNGRVVKDKLLIGTLRAAFSDFIPNGRYPVCALFLTLPAKQIDVNVHPAKTEIRFRDPQKIRHFLFTSVKQTLQQGGHVAVHHSDSLKNSFNQYQPYQHHPSGYQIQNPSIQSLKEQIHLNEQAQDFAPPANHSYEQNYSQQSDAMADSMVNYPMGAAMAQIHENYIIAQNEDGFIIIDQHAAHERIVYEKLKQNLQQKTIESQKLLVPEILSFSKEQCDLLLLHQQYLNDCGLEIKSFGSDEIIIHAVPSMLKKPNFDRLFDQLLEAFANEDNQPLTDILQRICATIACYGSIRSGRIMQIDDMNALLRQMEQTPNAAQCNHGRPTYIKMNLHDLEKLFERR
ncbi:MAG: DNA mismatch repair endonuclease MutL [Alphaproteobacteria bacterium]|nr:DNA mismatch repair endonuclease MutL [Alphaproteobacteria bacterium]